MSFEGEMQMGVIFLVVATACVVFIGLCIASAGSR